MSNSIPSAALISKFLSLSLKFNPMIFRNTAISNACNLCSSDLLVIHVSELSNKIDDIKALYKRFLVFLMTFEFQISPKVAATPVARLILLLMLSLHLVPYDITLPK